MPLSTDQPAAQASGFGRVQGWIAGITALLVAVPAIMNGAYDIYASAVRLPHNESERVSAALFKKYFNQPPRATVPVPITLHDSTVQVQLQVYDGGDIYVEFGNFGEWFPYPGSAPAPATAALALIGTAYAQPAGPGATAGAGTYRQHDTFIDGLLVRHRLWQNGVLETKRLDPRTGEAVETDSHASTPAERAAMERDVPAKALNIVAPINLDALQPHPALVKLVK